mmetsp:Transcript_92886/g.266245  ORF Transcript_92886/g.266245 Transcript_92886/m.266245 type:complete len:243 (-) Transcript_92886:277-1005(-)
MESRPKAAAWASPVPTTSRPKAAVSTSTVPPSPTTTTTAEAGAAAARAAAGERHRAVRSGAAAQRRRAPSARPSRPRPEARHSGPCAPPATSFPRPSGCLCSAASPSGPSAGPLQRARQMQLPAAKPVQHCHGFPSRGTPALQLPRCAAPSPIAAPCQGCPTLQWQWRRRRRQRPRHCRQSSGRAPDARQPIETFLQHRVESGAAAPLGPGRSSRDRRRCARQYPAAPPRQLRARRRPPKLL